MNGETQISSMSDIVPLSESQLNTELFNSLPTLPENILCTRSFLTMRGHTGFLTIAQYLKDDETKNETKDETKNESTN